jgi:hypothetical protein
MLRQQPEPEVPANREELRAALWRFLKERLAARRKAGVALGDAAGEIPLPRRTHRGGVVDLGSPRHDATLDAEGKSLLCQMYLLPYETVPKEFADLTPRLVEEVYLLLQVGVLRPHFASLRLFITEHGAFCLDQDLQDMPPTSTERVAAFLEEFAGSPDVDVLARHLGEAVAAYRAGLNLSATVMIGCCYELGLDRLVEAVCTLETRCGRLPVGVSDLTKGRVKKIKANGRVGAIAKGEMVHDVLVHLAVVEGEDLEWVTTCLNPDFFFVGLLRNAAGHPTGKVITRDQIASHIMLFTACYRRVRSLVATLGGLASPLPP